MELLTQSRFQELCQSDVPVLVDFFAAWCGPCKLFAPSFEALAEQLRGQVIACKCDIDQMQPLAARYEIKSVPTVVLLRRGQELARMTGVTSAQVLRNMVRQALSGAG